MRTRGPTQFACFLLGSVFKRSRGARVVVDVGVVVDLVVDGDGDGDGSAAQLGQHRDDPGKEFDRLPMLAFLKAPEGTDDVEHRSSVGDRGPLGQDDLYVARHGPAMSKAPDTERVAELRLRDYIPTIQTIAAGCKKAVDVRGRGCALAIF